MDRNRGPFPASMPYSFTLFSSLQSILTAWTYQLKKVPETSLLSLKKQLSSYKILPVDGRSLLAFWGEPYLAFAMLHLPLLF